jgi:COP9 signalosome complex subunit 5
MASGVEIARKQFELENKIAVDEAALYVTKPEEQEALYTRKPWKEDVKYFKRLRMSAVALVKLVTHARSGNSMEVMGLLVGKVLGDSFVVLDSFPLPVEGTETRVNAGASANEFMIKFIEAIEVTGRADTVVGWYHSHPGYGCWLSGIDVQTQSLYQQHQEPFCAVVVDPTRTCASGRVEIGAFRTYPSDYTPPEASESAGVSIPLDKIEDFGVHASQYYPMEIDFFRSTTDALILERLWAKYWTETLSSNPLFANRSYFTKGMADSVAKLEALEGQRARKKDENALGDLAKGSAQNANGQLQGLAAQALKFMLFQSQVKSGNASEPAPMDVA